MKELKLTFGPVNIKLISNDDFDYLFDYLGDWFQSSDVENNLDATFYFSDKESKNKLSFWDERAWLVNVNNDQGLNFFCTPKLSGQMKIIKFFPDFIFKILLNDAPGYKYFQATYFVYNVLIPTVQKLLLDKNCSFIHSSSVSSPNGAYLFTGEGGVGKTSISSYLYFKKSDKFNFLGDDLSIISSNGMVFLNPMPANIYPYNVECFPELQKYLNEKMSFSERMLWALRNFFLGPKKAMKRISAPEDKVKAKKISLNTVFYLSRENIKDIVVKKVDIADLSYVSKNILLDEFKNKLNLFTAANIKIDQNNIYDTPSVDRMLEEVENIFNSGFKNKDAVQISIPQNMNVEVLGEKIVKILDKYE
jgi:hypothetical protein